MRFMLMRKADAETEAGLLPSAELLAAMQRYNEELAEAGVLLQGEGLQASANGARVIFTDGTPTVTDGPFAETKELIAGFTMIEVASKDEAVEWVKRWPRIDGHGNVKIEIRPLYEPEDFSPGAAESP
ncbi:MAG: YciI family protein [Chloroflexota bacterium]|nr:YciI family protein [Chloroflexota bacterium]